MLNMSNTKAELEEAAAQLGVFGISSMSKRELLAAIEAALVVLEEAADDTPPPTNGSWHGWRHMTPK